MHQAQAVTKFCYNLPKLKLLCNHLPQLLPTSQNFLYFPSTTCAKQLNQECYLKLFEKRWRQKLKNVCMDLHPRVMCMLVMVKKTSNLKILAATKIKSQFRFQDVEKKVKIRACADLPYEWTYEQHQRRMLHRVPYLNLL